MRTIPGGGRRWIPFWLAVALLPVAAAGLPPAQPTETLTMRGRPQTVRVYGTRGRPAVIVSSGDGGWMHLGPHVAEVLAGRGYFVLGFDVKAYLTSFTSGTMTLGPDDEAGDYRLLVDDAARQSPRKPVLVGVSEGAGLSVMAAADPQVKAAVSGVIGLGLPDINELGWRWKDALIYVTHGVPREPTFSSAALVGRLAPVPLAAIHSTRDEFVPVTEIQRVLASAREPKRLWIVPASDHRFSDNLAEFDRRLIEAMDWVSHARGASALDD